MLSVENENIWNRGGGGGVGDRDGGGVSAGIGDLGSGNIGVAFQHIAVFRDLDHQPGNKAICLFNIITGVIPDDL